MSRPKSASDMPRPDPWRMGRSGRGRKAAADEAFRAIRPPEHGKDRLTVPQVAERLGLSARTVQDYRLDGRLPDPVMIGRTPTWTREQIDQWQANRPGRGARTDLRGRD